VDEWEFLGFEEEAPVVVVPGYEDVAGQGWDWQR